MGKQKLMIWNSLWDSSGYDSQVNLKNGLRKIGQLYNDKNEIWYKGEISENGLEASGNGRTYYSNGIVEYEGVFVKGQPEALIIRHYDKKGQVIYIGQMHQGFYQGIGRSFYPSGMLKSKLEYMYGWACGGEGFKYAKNGKLIYRSLKCGTKIFGIEVYCNGQMKYLGNFQKNYAEDSEKVRVFGKKGSIVLDGGIRNARGYNGLLYYY